MSHSCQRAKEPAGAQGWLGWRIIALFGRHRRMVVGLGFLILIASLLDLAVPFLTRGLIDQILHSLQSKQDGSLQMLILAAFGIFGATVCTRLLRSFYNYRLVHAASQVEDEVKTAAFANFLRQDTAYHGGINTGEVVGALDRGGTAVYIILYEILGQNLLPPLLVVIGVLTSLILKNPWIAAIVFLPLPAYVLSISRLGPRMHETENLVSRAFEKVTKESYDIASNVRVVKKFSREEQESATQRRLLGSARAEHFRAERLWAFVENTQSFIATAGRVGVIAFGGYLVLTRQCTVGDYVLFISMQDMVYGPISQLSIILPKLRRNVSRAERMFEILEERPAICDAPDAELLAAAEHSVEFRNLSFRYPGTDRWTLKDVNFSVRSGSTVALIGLSGSGKSTLMNLLQRLYDPQEGAILIDGHDIRNVTLRSLRDQISVVPQEVELFSRTITENIAYGQDALREGAVEQAARMAQAHDFIMRCENGYETQVGERGLKLSGGERQRIGIARAIVRDPKILILDEATSHLDNESERLIQAAMEQIAENRTCFIIAHRLSTVRKADTVVVFAEGGVEAAGTYDELWTISPTFRKLNALHVAQKPKAPAKVEAEKHEEELLAPAVGM
ncbi:MAG TPA: ABC transporter ATP-binding protein [Bryobacteraceae bacterium]|jgi:ABC-type multidrug transport system fused ATPase/permease subunit|nr:ABC transporter ATP-binding protein [Bryobacteraceae bacterium]